jgi:ABC-type glycerol-3-phosphate transport system permease component
LLIIAYAKTFRKNSYSRVAIFAKEKAFRAHHTNWECLLDKRVLISYFCLSLRNCPKIFAPRISTHHLEDQVNIPAVLAAVVLSTLPILVLYVVGRRQLLRGLTAGFGK